MIVYKCDRCGAIMDKVNGHIEDSKVMDLCAKCYSEFQEFMFGPHRTSTPDRSEDEEPCDLCKYKDYGGDEEPCTSCKFLISTFKENHFEPIENDKEECTDDLGPEEALRECTDDDIPEYVRDKKTKTLHKVVTRVKSSRLHYLYCLQNMSTKGVIIISEKEFDEFYAKFVAHECTNCKYEYTTNILCDTCGVKSDEKGLIRQWWKYKED